MRRFLALGLLAALALNSPSALAFCRATTCDPATDDCGIDADGCLTRGLPLFWASSCITVSVQSDAAPLHGIDYAAAKGSVERAFAAWTGAGCSASKPSINVTVKGPTACKLAEYNSDRGNANIVIFREDEWPYVGGQDALGITFLNFDPKTGELWDADIEVNAVDEPLSVAPSSTDVDLDSLLTHEAGHLLGLGHSRDLVSTMIAGYTAGSTSLRSLAPDDVSGICALYPPGRSLASTSCEPRHGYSDSCGSQQPAPEEPPDEASAGGCNLSNRQNCGKVAMFLGIGALALGLRRARRQYGT